MSIICPTILALNQADFNSQLAKTSFAPRIQVDVMDGIFAPTKSLALTSLPINTSQLVDLHVMFVNPQDHINEYLRLKPNMVIVHAESNCDIPSLAAQLRPFGIKTGLAILPGTKVADVEYMFAHVQQLLIFSGNLGHFGGQANLGLLQKITEAKHFTKHLEYGWDGGVNAENAQQLAAGGVDVLNAGGAIQKALNPQAAFTTLTQLIAEP